MDARVQLVFFGGLLDGFHVDDVKRRLGQVLRLDEPRLASLFSGARTVLKRSIDPAEAHRYMEHLGKIGARIHIEPSGETPTAKSPPAAASPRPVAAPVAVAAAPILELVGAAEEEIACPTCGERQSKRVFCRSCATNMPMGIAARLEAESEARAARQDALLARRAMRASAWTPAGAPGTFG